MVEQVKTLNALENAGGGQRTSGQGSSSHSGRNFDHPPRSASSGGSHRNNSFNRYVKTSLTFFGSFGGRPLDPWVLSTVSEGFRLEFVADPVQSFIQPNAPMDATQHECCQKEVLSLLEKGAVVRTGQDDGFISGIFLIPKRSGGYRPIINLKGLNTFLAAHKFKMEGISTVRHTIREGDWLAKLDLKDAYLTVPIFAHHRKFLRFKWGSDIFEFVSLHFGLSSAPWAFTKLLRVVIAHLRKLGLRLVIYLDDILVVASSPLATRLAVNQVRSLLESLGFVISVEKSVEDPVQALEYIGLFIDTLSMKLLLPERKRLDIYRLCKATLKASSLSRKELEKIIGNLNWAAAAVDFAQAHYRGLQLLLNSHQDAPRCQLEDVFPLSKEARADLYWWMSEANFSAGRSLTFPVPDM